MSAEATTATSQTLTLEEGNSLWKDSWLRLRRNHMAVASLIILVVITALCFVGPYFTGYTQTDQDITLGSSAPFEAEGKTHLFGTDELGRDQLTRVLLGGRISLLVGFIATAVSLCIGVTYGAISGYSSSRVDNVMMRFVDILYALPFTIFVILIFTLFGSSLLLLFAIIGAIEWLTMARIVRGQVLGLKKLEFVEAARSLGFSNFHILFRHIIPNTLGPIIVYTTLTIPRVILLESFLSFLGMGVQAPQSSWGTLIKDGADKMDVYPWLLIFPSIFFSLTIFSFNFLGDGLRDAFDPKSAKD